MGTGMRISRRAMVTSMAAGSFLLQRTQDTAHVQNQSGADGLPDDIEVRDFRILPGEDVTRFIVEVQNVTESAFDTPSLGVVIPGLSTDGNFGWATPVTRVLHPSASGLLIGVAPDALRDNDDWGDPSWLICDEIQTSNTDKLAPFDIELAHELEILGPQDVLVSVSVTNNGIPLTSKVTVHGLVRGDDGRACGATVPIWLTSVEPGTTEVLHIRINPQVEYIANPIPLLGDTEVTSVDFTFDTWPEAINQGCAPVMPWNR